MLDSDYWAYSPYHGHLCQVIEEQTLWEQTTYRVCLPGSGSVAGKIPENVLQEDPKLLMWYDQAVTRMGGYE